MEGIPNLQSHKALEVLWSFWKLQGVYSVEKYRFYQYLHAAFVLSTINGICSILFVGELFIVNSFKELLANLTMSCCLLICGYKTVIILRNRHQIIQIRYILDQLDVRPSTEVQRAEMARVCTTCNWLALTICFSYLIVNALFGVMAALSGRQHLVFPVWLPYDWRVSAFRFWMTWMYQNISQFFFCVQQAANDATGPIYLNVLNTHLRIIMYRIEHICNDTEKSDLDKQKEFIEAIEDHRLIMKVFDILQGTVSYTILLQFVGSCLVICMIILEYFLYNLTVTEICTGLSFLVAEMLEIAPCCYYSNEFMSSTDEFVNSIYSTNWTGQSIKFKKLMIIFMIFTQKSKVIIAGKVVTVTLSTFTSTMFQFQLSLEEVANDFLGALYLCILSAHLQIIMERFANIHYDPEKTEEESFQDFKHCLEDHRTIMDIFEIIQNTLSFTIFFQFITSILAVSTSGLLFLKFSPTLTETTAIFILILAEIAEIFPSCYYSDKFMEKTDQMVFMLYSSNWMDLSPKFRKHLIIFMQMTQKKKIILAGKQIPITLATFMSVSKDFGLSPTLRHPY
ncbi:unnamed protein product [Hermetia illucens]|uniref:Odorant receptor n=1 Tax=Hermetia illucens TaxID=343691 RepID=A0A7R8UUM0_HERIL|nr:unnamed protein product [Hermetia illucens]